MNIPQVMIQNNAKKSYGLGAGGFSRGMNSDPFTGQGFQVSQGVKRNNGRMEKLPGDTLAYDFGDSVSIVAIYAYEKSDGTFQVLNFINDGTTVKLRAQEADGTITTPSSGLGDVDFGSDNIQYEQISLTGYITSFTKSVYYLWDGETLTSFSGNASVTSLSKEGKRLNWTTQGEAAFSGADANPLTGLGTGSADLAFGNYTPNISGTPTGIFSGSSGTLIWFTSGCERHNIVSYDDGSGLRPDTRNIGFQYKGDGIDRPEQFTFGKYFGYAVNQSGIIRIDPQTGSPVNLIEEEKSTKSFRIKEYFDTFDQTNTSIAYAAREQIVFITMNTNQTGVNDINILYHEPTGDFHVLPGNYDTLGVVNEELYAGSSVDGKLFKVFDRNTYSDGYGNSRVTRLISEWDTMGSQSTLKAPLDFFAFFNAHSESIVEINLYINGDIDAPVATFIHTPDDLVDTSSVVASLGNYTLGVGKNDNASNSDLIGKDSFSDPFITYCWEIKETSNYPFIVNDIVVEYIGLNEVSQTTSLANKQFKL